MDALEALLRDANAGNPVDATLDMIPYAATLGLRLRTGSEGLLVVMPFKPALIGAPGRLHGGTIGALVELAGTLAVSAQLVRDGRVPGVIPRPVNVSVDYLRTGALEESCAIGLVTRLGRRVANVRAEAWQSDRSRLMATAHMNVIVAA